MRRRRYSGQRSSSDFWSSTFGSARWPVIVRSAYHEYFPTLEQLVLIAPGKLEPSSLKMILNASAMPAVQAAHDRSAPFSDSLPCLSGEFPAEPIHLGQLPPSASEPRWFEFAPQRPKLGFLEGLLDILSGKSASQERSARHRFELASDEWKRNRFKLERAERNYEAAVKQYESGIDEYHETRARLERDLTTELEHYADRKRRYEDARKTDLAAFDQLICDGAAGSQAGIEALARQVLLSIHMPVRLPAGVEVRFDQTDGILLFTISLPNLEEVDLCVQLKTKNRSATDKEIRSSQEFLVHALSLRLVHEIFVTPELESVQMVGVNMRLAYTDRHNGKRMNEIIGSLAATRGEFEGINVAEVDPKLCFRSLKGVAAQSFQDLSAIRPLLTFDRDDKRIVEGREVVDKLDTDTNLAAMDWEDFEHIVRELFAKMFSDRSETAEVHVTRASRDYGVDALIHDPDPIHGGKFVIQAKRYVNTVEVAAVRDLFGTVQNEGANRGYLVTTSSFGPDAYAFAKGKPLTLIDGTHLLQLLKAQGYSFRINLQEARNILHGR